MSSENVKVLYVLTRCLTSGPVEVIKNLVRNLDRSSFEIYLITISDEVKGRSQERALKGLVDHYKHIKISKFQVIIKNYKSIIEYINCIKPDVVHTTGIVPDYIINHIIPERQLVTLHSNGFMDFPQSYGTIVGYTMVSIQKRIIGKTAFSVACSKSISDIYLKKTGKKFPYIYNGIDVDRISTQSKTYRDSLRNELSITDKQLAFVYAGTLKKIKNQEFLLQVFSQMSDRYVLVLLGDGPLYNKL